MIANNLIGGAAGGAVVGMRWADPATADLTLAQAPEFDWIRIGGNLVTG